MKYLVFLKDIDPDSGKISQLVRLCECDSEDVAKSICWSMNMGNDSPNREYYSEPLYKDRTVFICTDAETIEEVWKCQLMLTSLGIRGIMLFSTDELDMVLETYQYHGVPYTIVQIGTDIVWDRLDYNLKIDSFSESTAREILNFLGEGDLSNE